MQGQYAATGAANSIMFFSAIPCHGRAHASLTGAVADMLNRTSRLRRELKPSSDARATGM